LNDDFQLLRLGLGFMLGLELGIAIGLNKNFASFGFYIWTLSTMISSKTRFCWRVSGVINRFRCYSITGLHVNHPVPKIEPPVLFENFLSELNTLKRTDNAIRKKELLGKYDTLCREIEDLCTENRVKSTENTIRPVLDKIVDVDYWIKGSSTLATHLSNRYEVKSSVTNNYTFFSIIQSKISELISASASIPILFDTALHERLYAHARCIYLCHLRPFCTEPSSYLRSSHFPWMNFMELAQSNQDWQGVSALIQDMTQLAGYNISASMLNYLLRANLAIIEAGHFNQTKPEIDSDRQILSILNMFDKYSLYPDRQTFSLILSHYSTMKNYERLVQFLPLSFKSKETLPDTALCRYILYHVLQEKHMPHLAMDIYEYMIHKDRAAVYLQKDIQLHETVLDGMLERQDLDRAIRAFYNYRDALLGHFSGSSGSVGNHSQSDIIASWANITARLIHLICVHQAFERLPKILGMIHQTSNLLHSNTSAIPAKLWNKIFTWILSAPTHQDDPFNHLQSWLTKLFSIKRAGIESDLNSSTPSHSQAPIFHLNAEIQEAILQLSSRFLISESFLKFLENSHQ
jgi:hypothetical protein